MYATPLSRLIEQSIDRLDRTLAGGMPHSAEVISRWMQQLAPNGQRADYFKHPLAFPSLLLPWWVNGWLEGTPNLALQRDLAYSTINGYYHVRLIDNVMDGEATLEPRLLPALNFFHTQFQSIYTRYFPAEHPFWVQFETFWLHSADTALKEATTPVLNEALFWQLSAQKVCAAKIPVAAVCHHCNQPEQVQPWAALIDRLGGWHQFFNDLFDWHRDLAIENTTWFLSEAARRKQLDEPVAAWVAREGFFWGIDKLGEWMAKLQVQAEQLACEPLTVYLQQRRKMLTDAAKQAGPGLQLIARLAKI